LNFFFQLVSYCVQKGEKVVFQNDISKPSWTLRGGSLLGGVLFSQREAFETGGENFKSWKCLAKSYSFTFEYLQKNFEKDLQKEFAKTKQVVQAWSKMLYKKETIHAYLVSIYIGSNSKQPLHLHYAN
jgi:hypothetical protein